MHKTPNDQAINYDKSCDLCKASNHNMRKKYMDTIYLPKYILVLYFLLVSAIHEVSYLPKYA